MSHPDIRVRTNLRTHPKWVRLGVALGPKGQLSLIYLWLFAREHRRQGALTDLNDREVEEGAMWHGKRGLFIETALTLGWLERATEGHLVIHSWVEHNPWAANEDHRSEVGRLNALKRWDAKKAGRKANGHAKGTCQADADSNANGNANGNGIGNAPLPSSPLPSTREGGRGKRAAAAGSSATRPAAASPADGKPTCAHCRLRATIGPSFDGYRPEGLDVDLCPGHLTEWYQARPKPGAEA